MAKDISQIKAELPAKHRRKWEALRRNEHYQNDWDIAFKRMVDRLNLGCWTPRDLKDEFLVSDEGQAVAIKYGLNFPYHYNEPVEDKLNKPRMSIFCDVFGGKVIIHGPTMSINEEFEYLAHLREGRYLTIEIDLQEHKGKLIGVIDNEVERYLQKIKARGSAIDFYLPTPNGEVSIYKIWDLSKKERKSPWMITQELFPQVRGTSYQLYAKKYQKETRAIWRRIKSAIKKADEEISQFNPIK